MPSPTTLEADQSALVQAEVMELLMRLEDEGLKDWRVALAGVAGAIANVVAQQAGMDQVPVWFAHMSATTMHLAKSGS